MRRIITRIVVTIRITTWTIRWVDDEAQPQEEVAEAAAAWPAPEGQPPSVSGDAELCMQQQLDGCLGPLQPRKRETTKRSRRALLLPVLLIGWQ